VGLVQRVEQGRDAFAQRGGAAGQFRDQQVCQARFGGARLEAEALAVEKAGKAGNLEQISMELPALREIARTTIEAIERRIPTDSANVPRHKSLE
jgi:hypothetical protein